MYCGSSRHAMAVKTRAKKVVIYRRTNKVIRVLSQSISFKDLDLEEKQIDWTFIQLVNRALINLEENEAKQLDQASVIWELVVERNRHLVQWKWHWSQYSDLYSEISKVNELNGNGRWAPYSNNLIPPYIIVWLSSVHRMFRVRGELSEDIVDVSSLSLPSLKYLSMFGRFFLMFLQSN